MKPITILLAFILGANLLADVKNGKAVYAANCAICHTVNGGNAFGPDLNIISYTRSKEEIEAYTKNPYTLYKAFGYSSNAMPTLPLKDQEFKDVAHYIDSLQPFKKWMKNKKVNAEKEVFPILSKPLPAH